MPGYTLVDDDDRDAFDSTALSSMTRTIDFKNLFRPETSTALTFAAFDHVVYNVREAEISARGSSGRSA